MTWDDAIKLLEAIAPILGALLAAKIANAATPHWSKWYGRLGKMLGIIVSAMDLARKPSDYVADLSDTQSKEQGR